MTVACHRLLFLATLYAVQLVTTCKAEQTWMSTTATSTTSFRHPVSTCPSVSVNCITYGLPQQCLKANLIISGITTKPSSILDGSSTTDTSFVESVTSIGLAQQNIALNSSNQTEEWSKDRGVSNAKVASVSTTDSTTSILDDVAVSTDPVPATAVALPPVDVDNETDSPLDNARFLSFEEWKKENLAQVGQSAEALGAGRKTGAASQGRKEPAINNGLDTLGDDSEIELDFSGFGGGVKPGVGEQTDQAAGTASNNAAGAGSSSLRSRSKDAGKTSKERSNYASFDCAANILKTNAKSKGSLRILSENKDSYMLNECKVSEKFIIVELCDDILVDTVVLANFEFFSSMFRTFKVSVSDRYPIKSEKWKELGIFEARNSREIQAFLIENPLIWARYIKIDFLTHYGREFYCPVSLLRVHGTTMMDEYRREELGAAEGDDEDEGVDESAVESTHLDEVLRPLLTSHEIADVTTKTVESGTLQAQMNMPATTSDTTSLLAAPISNESKMTPVTDSGIANDTHPSTTKAITLADTTGPSSLESKTPPLETSVSTKVDIGIAAINTPSTTASSAMVNATTLALEARTSTTTISEKLSNIPNSPSTMNNDFISTKLIQSSSNTMSSSSSSTSTSATHHSAASTPPATQESFFKSINKRLQALEANATLSLQYIEAQSQLLRDAFNKVEKRQVTKTSNFLETLNATVSAELARFKLDYDQLWQSTVLQLAVQREEGARESELLGERVKMLAEEMVGQKRIMLAQATALLFCAGLLIFTRVSGTHANLEGGLGPGYLGNGKTRKLSTLFGNRTPSTVTMGKASDASGRRPWKWDSPWMRSPAGTPRSRDVRSEGEAEAEADDEGLHLAMERLDMGSVSIDTLAASPGAISPENGHESVSEDEQDDGDAQDDEVAIARDDDSMHEPDADMSTTAELGKRPGIVGVQSAPSIPILTIAPFDGAADDDEGVAELDRPVEDMVVVSDA